MRLCVAAFALLFSACNVNLIDADTFYACQSNVDCAPDYECQMTLEGEGRCITEAEAVAERGGRGNAVTELGCTSNFDCPEGTGCELRAGSRICSEVVDCYCIGADAWATELENRLTLITTIACSADVDCGPNMQCQVDDAGVSRCIGLDAAADERARRQGAACASDADCPGLECQADDRGVRRCLSAQDAAAERFSRTSCSNCAPGELCVTQSLDGAGVNWCKPACQVGTSDPVCESWEVCHRFNGAAGRGACFLRCQDDDDCTFGRSCDTNTGACVCRSGGECDAPLVCDAAVSECTTSCASTLECTCGSLCEEGLCVVGCANDDDCCAGSSCVSGRCANPAPNSGDLGDSCAVGTDCRVGLTCTAFARAGRCLEGGNCLGESTCSSASECARWYRGNYFTSCLQACENDSDCGAWAVCSPAGNATRDVCIPRCAVDSDCPAGTCDSGTGRCICGSASDCTDLFGPLATCDSGTGACGCTPDCAGKNCGSDGCGGLCGVCGLGTACDEGTCRDSRRTCDGSEPDTECELARGTWCPPHGVCKYNSSNEAEACQCEAGFRATKCDGTPCTGEECGAFGDYTCTPI